METDAFRPTQEVTRAEQYRAMYPEIDARFTKWTIAGKASGNASAARQGVIAEAREAKVEADKELAWLEKEFERAALYTEKTVDGIAVREPDIRRLEAVRAKAQLCKDRLTALIADEKTQQDKGDRNQKFAEAHGVNGGTVTTYLNELRGELIFTPKRALNMKRGENHPAALDRVRGEIDALVLAKQATAKAVLPREEMIRDAIKEIDRLASLGEPRLTAPRGKVFWPHHLPEGAINAAPDAFNLMMWLHKDALIAKMMELPTEYGGRLAYSDRDKALRLEEIADDLLDLRRDEENLVCAIEVDGATVKRRSTDPRALLGIEGPVPSWMAGR